MKKTELLTVIGAFLFGLCLFAVIVKLLVNYSVERSYQYSPSGGFDCAIWVEEEQQYEYIGQVVKFKTGLNRNNLYYFEWHYDYDEPMAVYSNEPIKFQCVVD